jgi:hypothetical protein
MSIKSEPAYLPTTLRVDWWNAILNEFQQSNPRPTGVQLSELQRSFHRTFEGLESAVQGKTVKSAADAAALVDRMTSTKSAYDLAVKAGYKAVPAPFRR